MKTALQYITLVIIVLAFVVGMFFVARTVNYNLSYKGMVQETVREMVKPEALK